MSERFTPSLRHALRLAREEADPHVDAIGTGHLLRGLLRDDTGAARRVCGGLGLDYLQVRRALGQVSQRPRTLLPQPPSSYTPGATRALEQACAAAEELGSQRVQTTHLLLALLHDEHDPAARALARLGVDRQRILSQLDRVAADPTAREVAVTLLLSWRTAAEARYRLNITDEAVRAAVERGSGEDETSLASQAMHLLNQAAALVRSVCTPKELRDLEACLDELNQRREAAVAEQDFERAAAIRDEADRLQRQLRDALRELRHAGAPRLRVVDAEAVAAV
jgi:ATP-dependent Clp protease ATP-binding subunit ClpA